MTTLTKIKTFIWQINGIISASKNAPTAREIPDFMPASPYHLMGKQFTLAAIFQCDVMWRDLKHILNDFCDVDCVVLTVVVYLFSPNDLD